MSLKNGPYSDGWYKGDVLYTGAWTNSGVPGTYVQPTCREWWPNGGSGTTNGITTGGVWQAKDNGNVYSYDTSPPTPFNGTRDVGGNGVHYTLGVPSTGILDNNVSAAIKISSTGSRSTSNYYANGSYAQHRFFINGKAVVGVYDRDVMGAGLQPTGTNFLPTTEAYYLFQTGADAGVQDTSGGFKLVNTNVSGWPGYIAFYNGSVLTEGAYGGRYYKDGILATGFYGGVLYEAGKPFNGILTKQNADWHRAYDDSLFSTTNGHTIDEGYSLINTNLGNNPYPHVRFSMGVPTSGSYVDTPSLGKRWYDNNGELCQGVFYGRLFNIGDGNSPGLLDVGDFAYSGGIVYRKGRPYRGFLDQSQVDTFSLSPAVSGMYNRGNLLTGIFWNDRYYIGGKLDNASGAGGSGLHTVIYTNGYPANGLYNGTVYVQGIPAGFVYYYSQSSNDWYDANNWYYNSAHTVPLGHIPDDTNKAIILGPAAPYVDIDDVNWISPSYINIGSVGITFTSNLSGKVTSTISGTASATFLNTAQYGN